LDSGAHFHKADLQVHSPRDPAWSGVKPTSEDDRRAFAKKFIAGCREKGLDAVAITDHHDLAFVDYIREAAAAETDDLGDALPAERRLAVFPGVEVSLGVPCQALLILDADFPSDRLPGVLAALSVDPTDLAEASHAAPQQLAHVDDFKALYGLLDRNAWLKDRYVVLPHASDGGLKTLIRKGFHDKYKEMPCVGVYTDGDVKKLGDGNTRILAGEDKAWGNKRVAVIQTSDARSDSFAKLGKFPTWIKWATPTAEALRQACLAQESRITHSLPALPNITLTRLSVSNSKYMGPIELELNPQYNAIIGGRGTGKSTCLEYIRWALCDESPEAAGSDELPDDASRRGRLIDETLRPLKSTVDVHFSINTIPHVVRRYSETDEIFLKVSDGEFEPSKPDDVRSLLPIQAYSQRQLSSVAVRLDEVTRFVTAPVRGELADLQARATGIAGRIRENYATLQRHRSLSASIARDEVELRSLREQADNLRSALPDLSEEDQQFLSQKPAFDSADESVAGWESDLDAASSVLSDARRELEALIDGLVEGDAAAPQSTTLPSLEAGVREALTEAKQSLETAEKELHGRRAPGKKIARNREKWAQAYEQFEIAYQLAKQRSAAHETQLQTLSGLERRQREVRKQLTTQRDELKRTGKPAERHQELRSEWLDMQRERSNLLSAQCEALTALSDGLIRASLGRGAELDSLSQRFKGAIAGSGLRATKIESLFGRISDEDNALEAWTETMEELERLIVARDDPSAKKWTPRSALAALSGSELEKVVAKLTAEDVLEMSLMTPVDRPAFEYRIREADYIAFEVASAGQQATALLRVLLNQPGPPLLIDQPEDDLDSQVILDVVDSIWASKMRRQLIFTSHNANLVVNGDAELVACCDYRAAGDQSRGQIKLTGAIDIPKVRTEITTVMEGGEKAFRLRKEKYGF
jgi:type III restriction enzyme